MSIRDVQAIDVHGHFGRCQGTGAELKYQLMSGDAETIIARAKLANTRITIVSPLRGLFPRCGADPVAGNDEAVRVVAANASLRQWVVVDPLTPRTYDQAAEMLATPYCVGIKIHPEEHGYPIAEHGCAIFEFAERHNAIVSTHSGEVNSMPGDFVTFADRCPDVKLVLAHLGFAHDGDPSHQIRAVQASKWGNIYVDASSAVNVTSLLLEWAVDQIGAEKILYGSDTPLYFAPMQRARIDWAEIGDDDKKKILCENAEKMFNF